MYFDFNFISPLFFILHFVLLMRFSDVEYVRWTLRAEVK